MGVARSGGVGVGVAAAAPALGGGEGRGQVAVGGVLVFLSFLGERAGQARGGQAAHPHSTLRAAGRGGRARRGARAGARPRACAPLKMSEPPPALPDNPPPPILLELRIKELQRLVAPSGAVTVQVRRERGREGGSTPPLAVDGRRVANAPRAGGGRQQTGGRRARTPLQAGPLFGGRGSPGASAPPGGRAVIGRGAAHGVACPSVVLADRPGALFNPPPPLPSPLAPRLGRRPHHPPHPCPQRLLHRGGLDPAGHPPPR